MPIGSDARGGGGGIGVTRVNSSKHCVDMSLGSFRHDRGLRSTSLGTSGGMSRVGQGEDARTDLAESVQWN
jgi:hypothetical protein